MREILFRGKRLDNGEWIEGDLRQYPSGAAAIRSDKIGSTIKVDPATVGQYTTLKDKNDKGIFEGDVIRCGFQNKGVSGIVNFNLYCFCVKLNIADVFNRNNPALDIIANEYPNEIEVIGNIYDNPELIERSERDGHQTD